MATAAIIQYPTLLGEFKLTSQHFPGKPLLWQLVDAIQKVPEREPSGAVPAAHLAAYCDEDEAYCRSVIDTLLETRFYSAESARAAVRSLVEQRAKDEARARLRSLAESDSENLALDLRHLAESLDVHEESDLVSYGDLVRRHLDRLRSPEENRAVLTGIEPLDRALGGFRPGEVVIIAGKGGAGKSTLVAHLMREFMQRQIHSLFFSAEMPDSQWSEKLAYAESAVKVNELLEEDRLEYSIERLSGVDNYCHFDFRPSSTPGRILSLVRSMKAKHGTAIAFFDHLDHIDVGVEDDYKRITLALKAVREIARAEAIPFVVLTHFNRRAEGEEERPGGKPPEKPTTGMILGSGKIRDYADVIISPWRKTPTSLTTELWILKSRMTGNQDIKACDLLFDPATQRFEPVSADRVVTSDGKALDFGFGVG